MNAKLSIFCHPAINIDRYIYIYIHFTTEERREIERRVHLLLENALPLSSYHRTLSTTGVLSSSLSVVVIIVVVVLPLLLLLCVYMCVPEISCLIVVRLRSRHICGVFISIFNISPFFLFFFSSSLLFP